MTGAKLDQRSLPAACRLSGAIGQLSVSLFPDQVWIAASAYQDNVPCLQVDSGTFSKLANSRNVLK